MELICEMNKCSPCLLTATVGISENIDVADQLLIRSSAFAVLIDFKKAYESVRRDVLYNILIEFGVPMELVRLIKLF
jgi:hypothetical protein